MKTCSKCQEAKELSEFRKRKRNKTGYDSWCLECSRAHQNAYLKAVPWNLRVIHWTENRSKGNKLLDQLTNQNLN